MGEYAIRRGDNQEIKIGTCEMMYYIRYEDRFKVKHIPGNEDAATVKNCFWRLPINEENNIKPGGYAIHNSAKIQLYKTETDHNGNKQYIYFELSGLQDTDAGLIQLKHNSGLMVNVPCYHGTKLPASTHEIKFFWNGKDPGSIQMAWLKNTDDGVMPIIECKHCGEMWRIDWADIWDFLPAEYQRIFDQYRR